MASVWGELKRRKVVRVAVAYVIVGWLILQSADVLVPLLTLPEWVGRLIFLLLLIGFPLALFFAWAFELTPEGVTRTGATENSDDSNIWRHRAIDFVIIGALIAVLGYTFFESDRVSDNLAGNESTTGIDAIPSVAVLPFADMSPNQDQEYFSDGISEELLNVLARLDGLKVVGRTSSFAFKESNDDLREIGDRLGVTNVLEGSVRKDGDRVRVTAQLINSQTGFHLWSNIYDRRIGDIFSIQEDIARSVAGALSVALNVAGRNVLPGTGTQNVEAYDIYLEGQARSRIGRPAIAVTYYQRAVELDPKFADAWVSLGASTGATSWSQPAEQGRETRRRGRELVLKAIDLDPNLPRAYSYLGQFNWGLGDWTGAAEAHQKAISLAPSDLSRRARFSNVLGRVGRVHAAIELDELGRETDPLSLFTALFAVEHYAQAGLYSNARAENQRARSLTPTLRPDILERRLAIALSEGMPADIKASLQEIADAVPTRAAIASSVLAVFDGPASDVLGVLRQHYDTGIGLDADGRIMIAHLAAFFGDAQFALDVVGNELRGNLLRTGKIWYPFLSDMRQLPGFKILADEIGIVAYWRAYGWADFCRPLENDNFECF